MSTHYIIQAINKKRKLQFTYQNRARIVDPHIFGISTKGNEVILCWQTGGSSSKPGDLPNWRMFETHEIHGLQIMNDEFVPQIKTYNHLQSDILTRYAAV